MVYNPIYILEGPDGSGKTTLAEKLCSYHKIEKMHLTYYSDKEKHQEQFRTVERKLDEFINGTAKTGICFDRFIFSTKVYGDVFNNDSSIDNYETIMTKLECLDRLHKGTVQIIFTLPKPKSLYIENFNRVKFLREELYTDTDLMSKVYDGFDDIYHQLVNKNIIRNIRTYDYAHDNLTDIV